ncbi:MAG: sporulation protein YqfC [Defluviitaleaceae bacterium]|nr:sporulation protein YqfC [Defluviitaleaceae bacterium]
MGIFKDHLTELLSLPKEILLNLPQIILTGRKEISIENYKSIIEYSDTTIRINTSSGVLLIVGNSLTLKHMTTEYITIVGGITKLEFLG